MLSFLENRLLARGVSIAAALIAAMTLASFHEAKGNIRILINESAGEGIGKLKENTTNICGYKNTPACALPIALPVPIDPQVVTVTDLGDGPSDTINFGTLGGVNGIIAFSSDMGDTGPGDIDGTHTTTGRNKVTVDINIVSPAEGIPELATWAMMLIGFGLVGVRLRNERRLDLRALPLSSPALAQAKGLRCRVRRGEATLGASGRGDLPLPG